MTCKRTARALLFMALVCACAFSQSTTGSLQGTVTDPGDAAVPGVQIELKNNATGAIVTTSTGAEGIFVFNSLVPATYTLTVKPAAGFKTYTQSAIAVTADERRDLGKISLALGALTEQVSVTAITTPVQTASSENSKLIYRAELGAPRECCAKEGRGAASCTSRPMAGSARTSPCSAPSAWAIRSSTCSIFTS